MSLLDTASLIVTPNGYKEGKLYSVIPSDGSGDLSVTRATTATRVNSAGLVELVPYNLLSYSEAFDNAAWTKSSITISSNSTTAPDGQTTADTLTNSSSSGIILQTYSSVNTSQIVTHSVYLKRTNNDWAVLAIARSGATTYGEMYVWFNLSTGVVGGNLPDGAAVILDTEIENVGNGWYRCSVTGYVPNAVAYTAFMLYPDGNNSFTRVTGQSVYAWGAQLVEGSTAKDYQKTETRLNIPRLDYSNGTCPSLLVEPQRTNLLTYSSSFDSSDWSKSSGTITANSTTAPDGTTTADTFTGNGALSNHDFFEGFTGGANTTASIYVKKNTAQFVYISLNYQSSGVNWATGIYDLDNLTTATFQSGGVTNQVATITDEGNGWRRITLSVATANTSLYCMFGLSDSMSPTLGSRGRVENSSSQSFYAWGAQLEAGSYATSYIPTTSASVTRNADVISKTGISSLIGQTEGTLFLDFYYDGTTNNHMIINDSSFNSYIYFNSQNANQLWAQIQNINIQFSASASAGRHKLALAYKSGSSAFYLDGVQVGTSATTFTLSGSMSILDFTLTTPNNAINAAALWKTRLTNTQLAQLTTI
jgi:hypothetical protein